MDDNSVPDVDDLRSEVTELRESLNQINQFRMVEDANWQALFGGADIELGLTLEEIHEESKIIRKFVDESPLIGRAADLRQSYVFGKGIKIEGVEKKTSAGRPTALYNFFNNPRNQEAIFSDEAHKSAENTAATDGNFYLLGDRSTKELRVIPVWQIVGLHTHPVFHDEIWAYLWSYTDYSFAVPRQVEEWVYTDRAPAGERRTEIKNDSGTSIPVNTRYEIIDKRFNRQSGRPLGVPDLYAAVSWNKTYIRTIKSGVTVTDAMASIAFKATANTQAGADNAALKLAQGGQGRAKVAITGVTNDLAPLATTGRAYDFGALRDIAALIATAARVSVVHLLSSPGAAGSSYGAASTLDTPTMKAMVSRQKEWADFFRRVIRWGTGADVTVTFPPAEDADSYRDGQLKLLAWGSGLVHADEARPAILEVSGMEDKHESPPEGFLMPNNGLTANLARKDLDTDAAASNGGDMVPTQGSGSQFSGARADSSADPQLRTDIISNTLSVMNLDRLEALVERLEAAKDTLG